MPITQDPGLGVRFSNYRNYSNLASAATYTPSALSLSTLFCTSGRFTAAKVHVEFYDGSAWIDAWEATGVQYENVVTLFQDSGQNLRIHNADGVANKIHLTGVTWS